MTSLPEPVVTVMAPAAPPTTTEECCVTITAPAPVIADVEKEKEEDKEVTCCQVVWVVIALTLSGIAVGLLLSVISTLRCVYQCDNEQMTDRSYRECTETCLYGPPEPPKQEKGVEVISFPIGIPDEAGPPGVPGPSMAEEVPMLEVTGRECMKMCMGDDGYEYTDICKTKCQDVLPPRRGIEGCPMGASGPKGEPEPEEKPFVCPCGETHPHIH